MSGILLSLLVLYWPAALAQGEEALVIAGATVVDGTGAEPFEATVVVRGGRIEAVGPGVTAPAGARVIDARGQTLLPGIFDIHTHVPYSAITGLSGDWGKNLKAYLYCGVTTVVDFGTYPETFEPVRRLLAQGVWQGPRICLAARITTPGGHGAEGGRGDFFSQEVITPREGRAAVRRVLSWKPDVIKVFTDGWRYGVEPDMTSMQEDTLAAIVRESHKNGLEVLTHTVTLDKAKIAARAGVDVIAHGIGDELADVELIQLMQEKRTSYVPTLAVYEPREKRELPPLLSEVLEPAAAKILGEQARLRRTPQETAQENPRARRWRFLMDNTAGLRAAGVRFGLGTDAGVTGAYHGWATLHEMELLVAGGLTPLEALTTATGNSAKALNVDAERGTIAAGKLADLVLVEGAPHRTISDILRVRRVFLGGREVDRQALARDIASPGLTPMPALKASRLVDDFERTDGRSSLGTLRLNSTDSGHDNSKMLSARTVRKGNNHALTLLARMAEKDRPHASVNIPLSPGPVEPVDASGWRGVEFEARGEGEYRLVIPTRNVRDSAYYQAPFRATGNWKTVKVEFSSLRQEGAKRPAEWSGQDLLMLMFQISRPAGTQGWLELDNVRFYE